MSGTFRSAPSIMDKVRETAVVVSRDGDREGTDLTTIPVRHPVPSGLIRDLLSPSYPAGKDIFATNIIDNSGTEALHKESALN